MTPQILQYYAKFWLGKLQNPAKTVMAGVTGNNLRVAKSNWNEQV